MSDARDHTRAALAYLARSEIESDAAQRKQLLGLARKAMAEAVEEAAGYYNIPTLARELEDRIGRQAEKE